MGGLLFTADKAQILRITGRYHITHKIELLLFSSKTYSASLGQRKEHIANHKKTEPIKDLCKPELLSFKLFSFLPLPFFYFNRELFPPEQEADVESLTNNPWLKHGLLKDLNEARILGCLIPFFFVSVLKALSPNVPLNWHLCGLEVSVFKLPFKRSQ